MHTSPAHFLRQALSADAAPASPFPLDSGLTAQWRAPGCLEIAPAGLAADQDSVLLSCGVHGNETAPIEVVDTILNDLASGRLPLRCRLLALFGNLDAMRLGERYLDYDMNRLFNGEHARHPDAREAARAALLEREAARFFESARGRRLHYDLHTAIRGSAFEKFAIYPFLHDRPHNRQQLGWLQSCQIEAVLLHSKPANTFSYFTSRHCQADAFTLELGKARPFGQNDLARFDGIDLALRRLLAGEDAPDAASARPLPLFRAKYDIIKRSEAFRLNLDEQVENFTLLPDGCLIAEDGEERYVAHGGAERILFPNPKVKPGLRAGIVVEPAKLDD
ncbi:succinylglutamate desuccinylase [Xenophilus sp. AP218F]|nr:succinylglutamate desuccinylase [Xenophilus sp. AP218F]